MAKSTEQQLEEAIGTAARLADELTDHKALGVAFDLGASGEVPFRITVPDETLPLIGLATLAPRAERMRADNGA